MTACIFLKRHNKPEFIFYDDYNYGKPTSQAKNN